MKIDTKYYGEIDYTKDELVVFPDGLFGFSQYHDYLPLSMEEDDSSLLILQSVDEPYVAFFLIDAAALFPSYSPVLLPEELSFLEVNSSDELSYYAICTVKKDYLDGTVNLKCPLAINPDTRKGIQVILSNADYNYRHTLRSLLGKEIKEQDNKKEINSHADTET